jgi:hypothetical protein
MSEPRKCQYVNSILLSIFVFAYSGKELFPSKTGGISGFISLGSGIISDSGTVTVSIDGLEIGSLTSSGSEGGWLVELTLSSGEGGTGLSPVLLFAGSFDVSINATAAIIVITNKK